MLTVTRDMVLPTTVTGSYPRPLWFDRSLEGRSFKSALGDSLFREQYLDAVASIIAEQEAAGLDIVTDGDSRFDLTVGGKSWFFYPIERLGGIEGHRDTSRGWMSRHGLRPGKILWEVQEAYQPGVVRKKLTRGPLEYIPKEKLVISTDCGFGREGLSRRIAFYKCVALVEGTNIVRRELGLPEARVRAADPKLWFAAKNG